MKEKTSLERSHSVVSNMKLTVITLILAVVESIFWMVLAIDEYMLNNEIFYYILLIGSLVLVIIFEFIALRFKR